MCATWSEYVMMNAFFPPFSKQRKAARSITLKYTLTSRFPRDSQLEQQRRKFFSSPISVVPYPPFDQRRSDYRL